jgi:hypothetical protein
MGAAVLVIAGILAIYVVMSGKLARVWTAISAA